MLRLITGAGIDLPGFNGGVPPKSTMVLTGRGRGALVATNKGRANKIILQRDVTVPVFSKTTV